MTPEQRKAVDAAVDRYCRAQLARQGLRYPTDNEAFEARYELDGARQNLRDLLDSLALIDKPTIARIDGEGSSSLD